MALLFYSDMCSHCKDLLGFIGKHPPVDKLIRRHNVTVHGVPQKFKGNVKSVPTIITQQGQVMAGGQCMAWASSLVPPQEVEGVGGMSGLTDLSTEAGGPGMFSLDNYGQSIQPHITPDLQQRISSTVMEAYQTMQTSLKED